MKLVWWGARPKTLSTVFFWLLGRVLFHILENAVLDESVYRDSAFLAVLLNAGPLVVVNPSPEGLHGPVSLVHIA